MSEFNPGLIPTPSRLPAILIAAVVLLAGAAAVIYFNPHESAQLSITRVQLYASHIETQGMKGGTNVVGSAPQVDNDLYVLLTVKLIDKSRLPIFIKDETAVLTAPDHSVMDASAIEKLDLSNVYTTFPALKTMASEPLFRSTRIEAGQTAEGMVLIHFPGETQDDWNKRESATLTIDLFHGPSQTIKIP